DSARVVVGSDDFNAHDRFEQYRTGFFDRILERERTGNVERTLIRIDFVIRTEHEPDLDVDHLVSSEKTTLHRVADSLFDRLDVFLRNRAAGNLVLEYKTLAWRRLDLDLDVSE